MKDFANKQKLGFGLGLRQKHVKQIISDMPSQVDWYEIISENYFNPDTERRDEVEIIRQDKPFAMHGVSMSLGSSDEINVDYLTKLKSLEKWLHPEIISDHICWTGINKFNSHDLLPVPYTEESLKNMVKKIQQVQDFLGRNIAIENPSTYLEFDGSTINEWDYIKHVLEESDCDLLLDINNVYVNCFNHGYDAEKYINTIPEDKIVQIHMAGHKNYNTHIIDTHGDFITDEVLNLYKYTVQKIGYRDSMIEWDTDIPKFEVLLSELEKLKIKLDEPLKQKDEKVAEVDVDKEKKAIKPLKFLYNQFQTSLLNPHELKYEPEEWIKTKGLLNERKQFDIYSSAYRYRLFDLISGEFNASKDFLGEENFNMLLRTYIERQPSKFYNLEDYIFDFGNFAAKYVDEISLELITIETEISKLRDARPIDFDKISDENTSSYTLLQFENDVNDVYKACLEENLLNLNLESVKNKETTILLVKTPDGVFRKKINNILT